MEVVARRALLLLIPAILFLGWFLLLRPAFLGGATGYTFVSGESMEPVLFDGDLVITRKQDSYGTGDIVVFRVEGGNVIHRVIGGDAVEGYVVQGDNKELPDLWRPMPSEIEGRKWVLIPSGGHFVAALRHPLIFAIVLGVLGYFSVLRGRGHGVVRTSRRTDRPNAALIVRVAAEPSYEPTLR